MFLNYFTCIINPLLDYNFCVNNRNLNSVYSDVIANYKERSQLCEISPET